MKLSFRILFILFICLMSFFSFGNEVDTPYLEQELVVPVLENAVWDKATDKLDYGEGLHIETPKSNVDAGPFLAGLLKVFLIVIVLLLVFFLLRYFVGIQGVQKATNRTFDPNETIDTQKVAEHIHEFDLNALIQQAIDRKEYTVATRLYYLKVIKSLSEGKLIQWKKDKTNRNYLNELSGIKMKNDFRELTNIFERVWYGEAVIQEGIFGEIQQQFQQFINKLPVGEENVVYPTK